MLTSMSRMLAIGGIVALAVAVIVVIVQSDRSHDLVLKVEPASGNDQITVYAGGAVATPGLYTLPRGSRIASLIEKSGLRDGANTSAIQMAAELRDGQQVIVPTVSPTVVSTGSTALSTSTSTPSGPININTASAAELDLLPGIGPALAQRIVDYRTAHGPFATVDELANVQGISQRMVQDFGDLITVGP